MMKKYMLLLCVAVSFSCSNELPELSLNPAESEKSSFESCTTIEPVVNKSETGRVSIKGLYWRNHQTIKIKFLDGDEYLQSKVKKYAYQWLYYANLNYEWVSADEYADIKIAFRSSGKAGNWSYIGTLAQDVHQQTPTMHFGSLSYYSDEEEFRRVVLHEFGHALGFVHEHQSPVSPILWNKPFAYIYFASKGWDKKTTDEQVFHRYSRDVADYTSFDKESIMLYTFPAGITLNKFSFPKNTVLSEMDKQSAREIYP